ncbi:MAG: hypothetical protein ACI4J0_07510 [Huintestinicola sp.]|uniref:hypothetical protein n=1 Tax=Huintestinicola sp. TaxID=2981661 RepID=UPI003F07D548
MMKFAKVFIIAGMLLLTACSASSEVTETETSYEASLTESITEAESDVEMESITETATSTETEEVTESVSETEWQNPAFLPVKLSERDISGYTVSGYVAVYDEETNTRTSYMGEITDEEGIAAVKEFIALTEELPEADQNEFYEVNVSCDDVYLTLTDELGNRYAYKEVRFTENGSEASYLLRHGVYGKDTVCVRSEGEEGYSLYSLMERLIAKEENVSERMEYDVQNYRTDIALITEYRNWAWGYQHSGNVIDMSGNVYSYDFGEENYNGEEIDSDEAFISALMEICSEGEPVASDSSVTDTLKKIRELADGADRKAKMISESAACDAGQHTIYAVTSDYKLVTICSDGDSIITSTDENALEIQRLCEEMGIH